MKINVIGIKKFDFTNDKGQRIVGTTLFYISPIPKEQGIGDMVNKVTIPVNVQPLDFFDHIGPYEVEQWENKIVSCKRA